MTDLKLGILLWSQAGAWPDMLEAARRIDGLGYDHLWTWDHLYAIYGDPYQPIFEGNTLLAGWAMATERTKLGLLVGANTFRNPGLLAKTVTTLDHISGGRAILGIGGAWFDLEHQAHGIPFGTGFGQRLDWMDEATGTIRALLDGGEVTSGEGDHYRFDGLRHEPPPLQAHLPIMIGGSGEKKTLRSVAKYADMWNAFGFPHTLARKDEILREHCAAVGRDSSTITRTIGCKMVIRDDVEEANRVWAEQMAFNRTPRDEWDGPDTLWVGGVDVLAERIRGYVEVDVETIERLIGEVKPLVDRG